MPPSCSRPPSWPTNAAPAPPTLDPQLFTSHDLRWADVATFTFGTAFTAMFFGSYLFLTDVWGWSVASAGLGISPGPLLVGILAPFFGKLAGRIGQRPLLIAVGLLYATGGAWRLLFLSDSTEYVTDYLPSMLLTGLGVALCFPQLSSAAAQAIAGARLGVGGAVNQAVRQLGGTIGVALGIALIGTPDGLSDALLRFDRVWVLIVVGGVITWLLCSRLRTRPVAAPPLVAPASGA